MTDPTPGPNGPIRGFVGALILTIAAVTLGAIGWTIILGVSILVAAALG